MAEQPSGVYGQMAKSAENMYRQVSAGRSVPLQAMSNAADYWKKRTQKREPKRSSKGRSGSR
jgi:hypothetical protein